MKKVIAICLVTTSSFMVTAQTGIKFQTEKKWDAIKAEAKAANKLIFLDAYTTWCGPCKKMSNEVFTKNEVASLFNNKFINAKIDMEKGEGLSLASKYVVTAYPTLLFIDGNGKIVHKVLGYKTPEELIEAANDSQDPNKQYSSLLQSYQNGKLPDTKIMNLLKALDDAGEGDQSTIVANTFLAKNRNWMEEPQLNLLVNYIKDVSSNEFQFLINNEAAISKISGYQNISSYLDKAVISYVVDKTFNEDEQKFDKEKALNIFKTYRGSRADKLYFTLAYDVATYINEPDAIEKAGLELDKYAMELSSGKLNEMAWYFFENIKNKASLKKALEWALLSVKIESNYFNNDTVANLYAKLGDKARAKKYAEIAIKLGVEQGADTEITQQLLKTL